MQTTYLSHTNLQDAARLLESDAAELRAAAKAGGVEITSATHGYTITESVPDLEALRGALVAWRTAHPPQEEEKPRTILMELAPEFVPVDSIVVGMRLRSVVEVLDLAREAGIEVRPPRLVSRSDYEKLSALMLAKLEGRRPRPVPLGVQEPVVRTSDRERFPATPPAAAPKPGRKGR